MRFLCQRTRGPAAVWRIPEFYPYGRMIAGALHSADMAIDAGVLQALRQRGTQHNVVETRAPIAFPTLPHVGLGFAKPVQQVREATIDALDVETGEALSRELILVG